MSDAQTAKIALKPSQRLALINWFTGKKWKGYDDRRKRRRLREALRIQPDRDYRIVTEPAGENERGEKMYRHIIELGRFVGDDDEKKFQRLTLAEGRHAHLFDVTMDQVDYMIGRLKDEETVDGQADTILDIEDALHAIKSDTYQCPPVQAWADLPDEAFKAVKDPETNADEADE